MPHTELACCAGRAGGQRGGGHGQHPASIARPQCAVPSPRCLQAKHRYRFHVVLWSVSFRQGHWPALPCGTCRLLRLVMSTVVGLVSLQGLGGRPASPCFRGECRQPVRASLCLHPSPAASRQPLRSPQVCSACGVPPCLTARHLLHILLERLMPSNSRGM